MATPSPEGEGSGNETLADFVPAAQPSPAPAESGGGAAALPVLMMSSPSGGMDFFVIRRRETEIGRDPDCHVRILAPTVSRHHATIAHENPGDERHPPACMILDKSQNGTLVNGERIDGFRPLRPGDTILIGGRTLAYFHRTPQQVEMEEALRDKLRASPVTVIDHRFTVETPATLMVIVPEETFRPRELDGVTRDISLRGLRMALPEFPEDLYASMLKGPRYAKIRLKPEEGDELPRLHGRIAWVDRHSAAKGGETQVGVQFEQLNPEARAALNDFLSERMLLG